MKANLLICKNKSAETERRRRGRLLLSSLLVFWAVIFFSGVSPAPGAPLSEESKACLGCHAEQGIVKVFQNNESISAHVDAGKFRASAHSMLTCSDCHTDFSADKHPKRAFRSKEQYMVKSSVVCRRCHKDSQIKRKAIHARLLSEEKEGKIHVCTNCHGAHSVTQVAGEKAYSNEEQYCLGCHGQHLNMKLNDGVVLSLKVEASLLKASIHNKLSCSDCHFGFSDMHHPRRNFKNSREFSIASSDMCRRCHFDKYTKALESIHYAMLNQGNLMAPVCTDCHGSHSISSVEKERTLSATKCRRCHSGIYEIYAKSVHGNALFNENNQDVPVCIDCHTAHNIEDPLTLDYREKIPEMCSNCHANRAIVGKYGLSTDVVKTYLSDFHGITLAFYKKQQKEAFANSSRPIAVCTDCHGTHSISKTMGADAATVKANLARRCRKCHKDAAENFPDAWLSHYEPSLARAPLVYIINVGYSFFIPFLIIGVILQILLHIWRYAVNR